MNNFTIKNNKYKKNKYKENKKKYKQNKNKYKQNKNSIKEISKEKIFQSLYKNLKINYIFYISILVAAIILKYDKFSSSSFIRGLLSLIFISMSGYFVHLLGHIFKYQKIFEKSNNIFKYIPILNKVMLNITKILDFHKTIHHDTKINKKYINIFYEFINNFLTQGLAQYIVIKIYKLIDERACFIWGLFYASFHNINYLILNPKTHQDHHNNSLCNLGIDIWDIIFGTKSNYNELEKYNHYSINYIITTIIVLLLNKYIFNIKIYFIKMITNKYFIIILTLLLLIYYK